MGGRVSSGQVASDLFGNLFSNGVTYGTSESPDAAKTLGEIVVGGLGTLAGEVIGSAIPGIGTVAGGAIGGGIGTFLGGLAGIALSGGRIDAEALKGLGEDAIVGALAGVAGGILGPKIAQGLFPEITSAFPKASELTGAGVASGVIGAVVGHLDEGKNVVVNGASNAFNNLINPPSTFDQRFSASDPTFDQRFSPSDPTFDQRFTGEPNTGSNPGGDQSNSGGGQNNNAPDNSNAPDQSTNAPGQTNSDSSVFDTGTTPFNDYGLGNSSDGIFGATPVGDAPATDGNGTEGIPMSEAPASEVTTTAEIQTASEMTTTAGIQNFDDSALNANAQMEGDVPAESSPDVFSDGTQPVGYIEPAAFQAAFDPSVGDNGTNTAGNDNGQTDNPTNTDTGNGSGSHGGSHSGSGSHGGSSGGSSSGGGSSGGSGGSGGGSPIVLDVAGPLHLPEGGIKITPLSSSDTFFNITGNGQQHLTAWAGKGNGVLFFDPTGTGQLTQEKQIVFTAWDPGAKSDMQALADVFDTNHDGSLDAGDTDFNDFYVMVTNADGTQTAYSLAQLGITSINLNANAANIILPDGSSINGETTYTTSGGATGTAATVTFAFDRDGHVVATTTAVNADGSRTVANVALNADGSVNYSRVLNTSADGLSKTLTDLNNAGVVTTIQTDDTVVHGDGSITETLTNYAGGAIQANGELTASGTTGSKKLNSTTTNTSANGLVVTILRDQLGGGWTTQEEVQTTNADGSISIVVSNLNPDGSASGVTTTSLTADGLTRTTTSLLDGIAADSATTVDATVVNGTMRTETVTDSLGTTVIDRATTVTQTAANSVTRTTTSDLTDGTTLNLTSVAQTVTGPTGSTTTQTDTSANGTELDQVVTVNTPQSGGGLVTAVTTAELDGYGYFIATGSETTTISNAGATATTTVVDRSANGTLLSESVTTNTVGSPVGSATIYGNGDGAVTRTKTTTVNGTTGATTFTVSDLNADGSLVDQRVTTTSANGLSRTTQLDSTGATSGGAAVFDHTTTDVTTTSGGASTETVTQYGASTSNLIAVQQTTVSANGLTTTVDSDFTGAAGVADGSWDQVTVDQTVDNADGTVTETLTVSDGSSHVLSQTIKTQSADRKTITTTSTLGTTGLARQVETVALQANGAVVDSVVNFDLNGDVLDGSVTTISADGLTRTTQNDVQGQSAAAYAASGLSFDSTTTGTVSISANGSRTETTNVTSHNGTLLSTSSVSTSANGLSTTTTENPFATAHYKTQLTDVTAINSDGSRTETVSAYNYNTTLVDRITTTVSATGMATTVLHDYNGDGVTDQASTDTMTINANGSQTEVVTEYTGGTNGNVRNITTTTSGIIVQGAGLETTIVRQSNGSVPIYQVETIAPSANGTTTDTTQTYAQPGGALLKTTTLTTTANGLSRVFATAVNGDTSSDFWTSDTIQLNANGSQTETVANFNRAGLISETVTTVSANGLSKMTAIDANGALSGSTPVFNYTTTDNTVLNSSDGSRTETLTATAANGATIEQSATTTSADQQTITINRYLKETGTIGTVDQSENVQTQANGSIVDTITSYGASHNLLGTVVETMSGNGLALSKTYKNAGGTAVDTETYATTYDSNGDGGQVETWQDNDAAVGFTTSLTRQVTGNDQSTITTMALAGALSATNTSSFNAVTSDGIAVADTGITTETIADTINGASSANDTTTIVTSANQLTTTISTALGSAAPYIVQQTSTALDGSTSQVTTYYNPGSLSTIQKQVTINTSYDGRTVTTTTLDDLDLVNQSFGSFTPTFSGTGYNAETDTLVDNANGTTTRTRTGSGSFGASAYVQTVNVVTNADSSITTTTLNYDGFGVLTDQIVADISPDGLVKSYAYDTTGKESTATLDAAAADIIAGAAAPGSMLGTDIIESDATTLNADGSKTETVKTAFGSSFANQRSLTTTETSANGLVTTEFVDNDGSGIFQEVGTITRQSDGSQTEVYNFYDNRSGTQQIGGMSVGATLIGTNTYSVSADRLVKTLTTSTGITDTTATFANANGSYEFTRSVASGSKAASAGDTNGSASHFVDANGIDTWSWNNGAGSSGTIQIDLATEKQDIAIANEIYQTLFGHPMDDAETQYLAQFITNGVLDREALAASIVNTTEYKNNFVLFGFEGDFTGWNILTALENALGRLPTAEEMATFGNLTSSTEFSSATASAQAFVPAAVAIAQYATDHGDSANLTVIDPNQSLVAPPVQWENAALTAAIRNSGTYSFANFLLIPQGVTATINGNSNIIVAEDNQNTDNVLTVNGFNDAIEAVDPATINASNSSILVDDSDIVTVAGSNDQIAQAGPSELTLSSGTGDTIAINAAPPVTFEPPYTNSYSITNASNATIIIGSGNGTAAAPDLINGSGDTIMLKGSDYLSLSGSNNALSLGSGITGGVTVSGSGNTVTLTGNDNVSVTSGGALIKISGGGDTLATTSASISVGSGLTGVVVNGNGNTVTLTGNDSATVSGANDTVDVTGSNVTIAANNVVINVANGVTNLTVIGTGDKVVTVVEPFGSISLVEIGNDYFLDSNATGAGPELMYGGAAWTVGTWGSWAPIGAEAISGGYEVAFKLGGTNTYTVWNTDANGNITSDSIGSVAGNSAALESLEPSFHQDLNGDGFIGIVVESAGSTSLVQVNNNYFLDSNSTGTGPELMYQGAPVTVNGFGTNYVPLGVERTSTGYDVAWENTSNAQYTVWATDSSGNYQSNLFGWTSGTSIALQYMETLFHQDLNGDGTIGIPNSTVIELFGSTSLVQVGNDYYLLSNTTGLGSELMYGSAPLTVGEFAWTPIAVEQTSTGYEIAIKNGNSYSVWYTDTNGSVSYGATPLVQSIEPSFQQDLNGDGIIGLPTNATLIEQFGSTSLVEVGSNYYLDNNSTGVGPELKYQGSAVTSGEFSGTIAPVGVEQTATGYEVAWRDTSDNKFLFWNTDSSGNFVSDVFNGWVSPASPVLESQENTLHQDLNGDGTIGLPAGTTLIESFGSTSLVQVGNNYYLESNSTGAALELIYGGSPLTVGEFVWTPFAAEQTSSGYDVALSYAGSYGFWSVDTNGNVITGLSGSVESFEPTFQQDLNGDGVIGYAVPTSGSLELSGAISASVQFIGSTGTLILDNSSQFSGQILNFTGTGSLSSSDEIDLKDIGFGSGTSASYAGNSSSGTLTVTDSQNHVAHISFAGSYTTANFSLSSDGSGGTIVIDPPAGQGGGPFSPSGADSTGQTPAIGGLGSTGSPTLAATDQSLDLSNSSALDSQLNRLVQAMASYSPGNNGLESLVPSNAQLPLVPATVAASWH